MTAIFTREVNNKAVKLMFSNNAYDNYTALFWN